jgi:hypothetical protein
MTQRVTQRESVGRGEERMYGPRGQHSADLNATRLAGSYKLWATHALVVNHDLLERCQRPTPHRSGEGGDPDVADLIIDETKHLRMAHQTKHMSQESAYAMSQGMGTR